MFGSLNENLKFFNFWQLNCRMISNKILHCSVEMYGFQHDIKIKKCDEDDPVSLAFVWYKSQNFPQPESIAGWDTLCDILCAKIRELCSKSTNVPLTTIPATNLTENGRYLVGLRNGTVFSPSLNEKTILCDKKVWEEVTSGVKQGPTLLTGFQHVSQQSVKLIVPYHATVSTDDDPWDTNIATTAKTVPVVPNSAAKSVTGVSAVSRNVSTVEGPRITKTVPSVSNSAASAAAPKPQGYPPRRRFTKPLDE